MPNDTCDKVLQALRARNLDLERERIGLVVSGTNRVAGDLDGAHVSIALMVSAGSNTGIKPTRSRAATGCEYSRRRALWRRPDAGSA